MITDIRLQNFRSYKDDSFELSPGVNIIVGPNASGKTNLLEAVLVLSIGKSYRNRDQALVHFGKPWARLDAHTPKGQRTVKLEAGPNDQIKKSYQFDDKPYQRLNLDRTLPVVLFEPNDLRLVNGEPGIRRDFLDDLAEQIKAGYADTRRRYRRALSQRNSLLKHGRPSSNSQLFAWNIRLSELGGQIAGARQDLLENINKRIAKIYSNLAGHKTKLELSYQSTVNVQNYSSSLLKKLEQSEELDYLRGFTAHGPHRDELAIEIGGKSAGDAASRGEVRTFVLALKIIELMLLEETRQTKPILLLDDVFSELDGRRRKALTEFLQPYQTFITTTDADVVVQHFTDSCNVIALNQPR